MNTLSQNPELLQSWKEIATYLGCGVRTVQRYELNLRLPVRRVAGKRRSSVLALKGDLDSWLRNSPISSAELAKADHLTRTSNKVSRASIALDAHQQILHRLDCNVRKLLELLAEGKRSRSELLVFESCLSDKLEPFAKVD
jgi:hypothetical protein